MGDLGRWLKSRTNLEKVAMLVFLLGGIFLLWYELCHIASFNHDGWSMGYIFNVCLGIIFAVNIYGNWVMMMLSDPTGRDIVFPCGPTPPGWRYCDVCVANRPPRSHHCPVCKTCILKRDHHCWFAGTCVGHANHRYFFVLIVYIVVAGVYCNLYNWSFVWSVKGEFSLWTIVSFIAPHVSIVLGYESLYSFLITSLSTIGFSLTFLFSWLLQIQLAQVVHGQTRYERKKGIKEYDQGLWENLRQILGNRMFLVFLFPWIPSSVPGDGTKFYSHSQKVI
ncbi:hypothetical protein BaRGS_00013193 [Batillaria attramentaria]|uniref:Palmitoyltransferase n=1 Tax=Batillaria attramentaria TaxID=370345 RepID=A0ABD0L892_9CAEN